MQTEKMPLLQRVIFTIVSLLLLGLWVSHAGDHVVVAKLTVEKLVWGIVIWLLCLYLVLLKPAERVDALLKNTGSMGTTLTDHNLTLRNKTEAIPFTDISVGADWDMPRGDRAQIDLGRLPLLLHTNRGLPLDRFADLASRTRVAGKRRAKLHE